MFFNVSSRGGLRTRLRLDGFIPSLGEDERTSPAAVCGELLAAAPSVNGGFITSAANHSHPPRLIM